MIATSSRPKRGSGLLQLIRDHGPVSIDILQRMAQPQMSKKNIRKSLGILRQKNLIELLNLNSQTTYYQIAQSEISRKQVAEILQCRADEITRPLLRKQDWLHNQWSEYWIFLIKRLIPEAEIVRERTIGCNEIAKRILRLKERDFDLMPDFLLMLPKEASCEPTYIAFEIERTRKSNERIMRKFKKYMEGTKIDGLIYICDSGRLSETIRMLYQSKLVTQSKRIKHYADHFFLFSDSMDGGGLNLNRLFNAKAESVSFVDWCVQLRTTKWTLRRDTQFK